jgi:hypothetical protein
MSKKKNIFFFLNQLINKIYLLKIIKFKKEKKRKNIFEKKN